MILEVILYREFYLNKNSSEGKITGKAVSRYYFTGADAYETIEDHAGSRTFFPQ